MRAGIASAVLALLLLSPAGEALAQRGRRPGGRAGVLEHRPAPRHTLELMGGVATFGRFLEQRVDVLERELTASSGPTLAAALGIMPWQKTGIRLGFTWASGDLEYQDDSGLDTELLDRDDLADADALVLSLELLRLLLDPRRRLVPYAAAGVNGAFWSLDGEAAAGEILRVDRGTQFRWGGGGAIGLQWRLARRWSLRLEANTFALGNPFDGEDAYRTATGETFDEPGRTRVSRFTLGVAYNTLRRR